MLSPASVQAASGAGPVDGDARTPASGYRRAHQGAHQRAGPQSVRGLGGGLRVESKTREARSGQVGDGQRETQLGVERVWTEGRDSDDDEHLGPFSEVNRERC